MSKGWEGIWEIVTRYGLNLARLDKFRNQENEGEMLEFSIAKLSKFKQLWHPNLVKIKSKVKQNWIQVKMTNPELWQLHFSLSHTFLNPFNQF